MKPRKTWFWTVLALWSLALTCLLLEGGVRLLGLAPRVPSQYALYEADPILPHKLRPNSEISGRSLTDEFDFHYVHNSLGLRDRERSRTKPPGTVRILGVGDSFTYGAGAGADSTYLVILERMLNARSSGPHVEVINAGVPRYFPEAERLYLQRDGLALEPDLVLVGFVLNDVLDTFMGADAIHVTPDGRLLSNEGARLVAQLGPLTTFAYRKSHACRLAIAAWVRQKRAQEEPVWEELYHADGRYEQSWRRVEREYEAMVELARGAGVQIAFVNLPQKGPWTPVHAYPGRRLSEWAERNGVAFIDTLPALLRSPHPEELYWPEDGHPREAAHAVFAEVLYDAIVERGLLPGPPARGAPPPPPSPAEP